MRWSNAVALVALAGALAAPTHPVAAQQGCFIVGCNSKWGDSSDELPGMTKMTPIIIGAVVVTGAVVAWRLLRSDGSEAEESVEENGGNAEIRLDIQGEGHLDPTGPTSSSIPRRVHHRPGLPEGLSGPDLELGLLPVMPVPGSELLWPARGAR